MKLKKLFALALAVCMMALVVPGAFAMGPVLTLGPANSTPTLVEENTPVTYERTSSSVKSDGSSGLFTSKEVTGPDADENYTITLKAYAEGEEIVTESNVSVPTDFVLVLDRSASMSNKMSTETGEITRVQALQKALKTFVGLVETQAKGADGKFDTATQEIKDDVDHRVALVGFSGETFGRGGNGIYFGPNFKKALSEADYVLSEANYVLSEADYVLSNDDYASALNSMLTSDGRKAVADSIDVLTWEDKGSTAPQIGLKIAENIFKNSPIRQDENRNRVVVLFTDGKPGMTENAVVPDYITQTINTANTLKNTYDATVFTVGFMSDLNTIPPTDGKFKTTGWLDRESYIPGYDQLDEYMHCVSSNFKNATAESKNYFLGMATVCYVTPGTPTYPE